MMYSAPVTLPRVGRTVTRGKRVYSWNTVRGMWTQGLGDSYCDTASALDPLSYLLCLPSDVRRVYSAATADFPAPPGAAAPGAPQTLTQMTVPGAYTPEQSAVDAHAASVAKWAGFYDAVGQANQPAGLFDSIPGWVWIAGAAGIGFLVLRR